MSPYVPLWCKSNFSFLEGASHPDELVEEAYRLGLPVFDGGAAVLRERGERCHMEGNLPACAGTHCALGWRPSLIVGEVEPNEVAGNLRDAFGNRFYGIITRHRREDEVVEEARLRERAKRYGFQLAAANEVLYHTPARRPLQDVLTAIRYGISVASCGRRLKANAEHSLHSPYIFARLFADDPAALVRTQEIASSNGRCRLHPG